MIVITITGKQSEQWTHTYEKVGRLGERRRIPTFFASIALSGRSGRYEFLVTRHTTDFIFDRQLEKFFGTGGECPPNNPGYPYHGIIHQTKTIPFGIRLHDKGCEQKTTLKAPGGTVRNSILIHHGPARSEGCFMVYGGKKGFATFKRELESLLRSVSHPKTPEIRVHVHNRPVT
ncbi:MAG: hypothetical protein AAGA35_02910 [Patescibacteria group bacterium]